MNFWFIILTAKNKIVQSYNYRIKSKLLKFKIKAKVHFSPLKFKKVAILAPKKNYNFGPFRSKIAEKTLRVPKKGS